MCVSTTALNPTGAELSDFYCWFDVSQANGGSSALLSDFCCSPRRLGIGKRRKGVVLVLISVVKRAVVCYCG